MMALFSVRAAAFAFWALWALVLAFSLLATPKAARAADIEVILDQARLVRLPDRVATIVIGNPAIADATVQPGGWIVITGKGYGLTNLVALDRAGAVLLETSVQVEGPRAVVVVHKGVNRETYSCSPNCERRFTLGDGNTFFESTGGQITARNALSATAAQAR
jgi:hypothetical protein